MGRRSAILFLSVLFVRFSFGQQKIDWSKYDQIAFKEDTTRGICSRNYKTRDHMPACDITESTAILELRVVPFLHLNDDPIISIFQFYEDSTVLTEYHRGRDEEVENFVKKYKDSSSEVYTREVTPLLEKTGGASWRINKKMLSQNEASNMLSELMKRNLFAINAIDEIEAAEKRINSDPRFCDTLKKYQLIRGPLSHAKSVVCFEIKYRNKFRSFGTSHVLFYYYDSRGWMHDIEIFKIGHELGKYLVPDMKGFKW